MPERAANAGFSLVEVVVSMLLIGIMAASFMSIALTGKMSSGRVQRRVAAAAAIRQTSEALKSFVTADRSLARGPGVGVDGWRLAGDQSGLYALDAGHHTLDAAVWAPDLAAAGGTIAYDVTVHAAPLGPQPTAEFSVTWDEP